MLRETLARIRRLEDLSGLVVTLGYVPDWREVGGTSLGTPSAIIVGRAGEFEWYACEADSPALPRRMARALAARGLPAAVLGLDPGRRRLFLASAETQPRSLFLDAPDPLDLARLARCVARPGESPLATAFRIGEALAGAGVDQRFFASFRRILDRLIASLPVRIPLTDRHALALLQLTRILFLYFVEAKGWMGRGHVLREEVDHCLSRRRSLHRDLLDPLFFGTLNRPYPARSRLARRFGPVPFLNGGLFEPHLLERRWRVTLPTPVLREAFDELFERFHFALTTGSGESVAPDMLGRVFEGVMDPVERHRSGTYYTPSALVEGLVGEALAGWLQGRLGIGASEAERRLHDQDALTRRTLRRVRVLDPAVGSGAFLLGALRLIAGPASTGPRRGSRLRAILGSCLFGVDRNAAAVRLAELRLWLEVIAAEPEATPVRITPLPNLDALIRQGDSLLDPGHGLPFHPVPLASEELGRCRRQVVHAAGLAKRPAVQRLQRAERALAETMLGEGIARTERAIGERLEAGRAGTLFGERRGLTRDDRAALGLLRTARAGLRRTLRELRRSGALPWFHYPVHFADIERRGGFDLVIGNPPWVRSEALPAADRRYLAERFRWFRPERSGTGGYRHLPDLSVAFLERAVELTAPGGIVAFLVPSKLATTGYAASARGGLVRSTTLLTAADLRHDSRSSFDATVYPMALIARREAPPSGHRVRLRLGDSTPSGGIPQRELGRNPWVLLPDAVRSTLTRIASEFPTLGERFPAQLGVKTGCNRAFLDPPESVEPALIRWAVRGRDVEPFRVRPSGRLLWPCDDAGRPLSALPPGARQHLERFREPLRHRSDHSPESEPLWSLFRTTAASARYRVIWPDLERRLTSAPLVGLSSAALIPLNTCYVMPVRDRPSALRLAAWLNSTWCRVLAAAVADPASGGFRRFNARVVSSLPAPPALFGDDRLLILGTAGVGGTLDQKDLDDRVALLLALTPSERAALEAVAPGGTEPGRRNTRAG